MKAERLAEIRERRDDQPWLFSGMIDELIDALTAERARAERAVELAREMFNAAGQAPGYEYEWREWATTLKELSK